MTPEECAPGTAVWAPLGSTGWRPAVVVGPAKGRVRLEFESGSKGTGTRRAESLRPRNPARKGKDKPPTGGAAAASLIGYANPVGGVES